jgi:DNA polymerase III subunit delta'
MVKEFLVHPETKKALISILRSSPHAIMLTGNAGAGKEHIGRWLAGALLQSEIENHAYFLQVEPAAGKALTIDQIRELQRFVRLKTTGKGNIRRVALVTHAHTLTIEAQNALLKLLEEPPADTTLILTAVGDKSLKPTIYSRVQKVHIRPVSEAQAKAYAVDSDTEAIDKAFLLSGGDPGLFLALLDQNQDHTLVSAIKTGKELLSGTTFQRLTRIDEISKDKDGLIYLLTAMKRISAAALRQSAEKGDTKLKTRWLNTMEAIYACEKHLGTNANTKLLLTDLFLSI